MIEKLIRMEEAPTDGDRRKYKNLTRFIGSIAKKSGVDFYPCRYGGKKGDMCATIAARFESGTTLYMVSFPGSRTMFSVRRDDVPARQLTAESDVSDALAVVALLEKVYDGLDSVAAGLGDELTVEACDLTWRLAPILPRQENDDAEGGGMPNMGGKSNVDPAMEARIKKALAEQLAKEGKQPTEAAEPTLEPAVPQIKGGHGDEVIGFAKHVAGDSELVCLDSGLAYFDIEEGEGDAPSPESIVRVHYAGRLADGTEFDSSYARGEPAEFRLDGVIAGWTEGVGSMRPGGKRRLIIPPELGYGSRGFPPKIPPDAMLDFDIELLEVKIGSRPGRAG